MISPKTFYALILEDAVYPYKLSFCQEGQAICQPP